MSHQQFLAFDSIRHEIQTQVDTILYSPDMLKLFAIVIEKIPEPESNEQSQKWYFNGNPVLGFRSTEGSCWQLYPETRPLSPINFRTAKEVSKVMRANYFSDEFREVKMGIFERGEQVFAPFKYNPLDSLFWTESLYWMKGAHTDSLYYFQTVRDPQPGKMTHALSKQPLPVTYPDSIRQRYGRCG